MRQDGTYREETSGGMLDGTIVCNPCYVALMPYTPSGKCLREEIDAGIAAYRAAHRVSA